MSQDAEVGDRVPLAPLIDHTALDAETTGAEIDRLCREAIEHAFAAVCVNPDRVERASDRLVETGIPVATVAGFPLGASTPDQKAAEAERALRDGAREIDMVAPVGSAREGRWEEVGRHVEAVARVVGDDALLKVILETAVLAPRRVLKAGAVAREAGGDFLKTSTGFHPAGGARPADVALLRVAAGPDLGVKAAGGIRGCADARAMIDAGATRIGTSSGVDLAGCTVREPEPLLRYLEPEGLGG